MGTKPPDESKYKRLVKFLQSDHLIAQGLSYAEKRTDVDRVYWFALSVVLAFFYMVFGYGQAFVVSILGFVNPAICTIRVIQRRESSNKNTPPEVSIFFSVVFLKKSN